MTKTNPFRYFKTSSEIIRLAVMLYVRYPLSLRNVEDLLHERGIEISHETVRFWWNRFGPMFDNEIKKRRIQGLRSSKWKWHLDEVYVKVNGETHYLWRAVDHEGEGHCQRNIACDGQGGFVASVHAQIFSLQVLQNQPRNHSAGSDALRSISSLASQR